VNGYLKQWRAARRDAVLAAFRADVTWQLLFLCLLWRRLADKRVRKRERYWADRPRHLAHQKKYDDRVRRPKTLETAFRNALEGQARLHQRRGLDLSRAVNRVVEKFKSRTRAKLVRRLRRYFEKAVHSGSKSRRIRLLGRGIPAAFGEPISARDDVGESLLVRLAHRPYSPPRIL
jgi:hypothetical protein